MARINDHTFVLDLGLGLIEPIDAVCAPAISPAPQTQPISLKERMVLCIKWGKLLDAKQASLSSLARQCGRTKGFTNDIAQLRHLAPSIQKTILAGEAESLSFNFLRYLRRLNPAEQRRLFKQALAKAQSKAGQKSPRVQPRQRPRALVDEPLRAVVYFNPEMFVRQRQFASERMAQISSFIDDLNRRLASPQSRRSTASIHAEVGAKLKRYNLLDAFEIDVATYPSDIGPRFKVTLTIDKAAWQRRRRHDGLCLLIAHPDIDCTAEQLIKLFHDKDAVEKDFQTIKSVVRLRPVRHRTDPKVRAHVTLCMLALLLERSIEAALVQAGFHATAPTVFETLAPCRLNKIRYASDTPSFYCLTQPTDEQHRLLVALDSLDLIDDERLRQNISPRENVR
jgi:hypothetical protein